MSLSILQITQVLATLGTDADSLLRLEEHPGYALARHHLHQNVCYEGMGETGTRRNRQLQVAMQSKEVPREFDSW
jgi:hypothetical protein